MTKEPHYIGHRKRLKGRFLKAGKKLGVTMHDHVFVAKGSYSSFKALGLL